MPHKSPSAAALIVLGLIALPAQQPVVLQDDGARFIIERAGGFGFANRAGTEVIPPKFTNAIAFSEGLAAVQTGGLWGYIDVDGKDVLPARFQTAGQFHEGLAAVSQDVGKTRFIDTRGEWAMPQTTDTYEQARFFSQGYAAVRVGSNWGFIDRGGRMVVRPRFEDAGVFGNDLVPVRVKSEWQYVDVKANTRIAGPFTTAGPFVDGVAAISRNQRFQFIDTAGKAVFEQEFSAAGSFREGLAPVRLPDEQDSDAPSWTYIDRSGTVRVRGPFVAGGLYVNGLALITDGVFQRRAYIDRSGRRTFFRSDRPGPAPSLGGARGGGGGAPAGGGSPNGLVQVDLKSTPGDASVFMIPLRDWERQPRLRNDAAALSNYQVPSGRTNTKTEVVDKVYMVLFTLSGHMPESVKLDVRRGATNVADVKFR